MSDQGRSIAPELLAATINSSVKGGALACLPAKTQPFLSYFLEGATSVLSRSSSVWFFRIPTKIRFSEPAQVFDLAATQSFSREFQVRPTSDCRAPDAVNWRRSTLLLTNLKGLQMSFSHLHKPVYGLALSAILILLAARAEAAWINTYCVVFLYDGRQIAVVRPITYDHCIQTAQQCSTGLSVRQISHFSNGTAVASDGVNLVCNLA